MPEEKQEFGLVPVEDRDVLANVNLPPVPEDLRTSDEWFDPERDLVMPRLKLLQAMTAEVNPGEKRVDGAVPGLFLNTLTKRIFTPPVAVVMVSTTKSAHFFAEEPEESCHSLDTITGSLYGACRSCAHNWQVWKKNERGDRVPPNCAETVNFLLLTEGGSPSIFACMKTALRTAKDFVAQRRAMLPSFLRNWWDRPVILNVAAAKNAKGQPFFRPTLAFDTKRTTDEISRRLAYECFLSTQGKRVRAETEEDGPSS